MPQTQVARGIFYTHKTSGACAGVCACDRTHQMKKTVFHRDMPVFPLILTETLAEYPLIPLSFSLGLKFINSRFSKTCHLQK